MSILKTRNTPSTTNHATVVAGNVSSLRLAVTIRAGGEERRVTDKLDLSLSCDQRVESLVGLAAVMRTWPEDASDTIQWMWVGQSRGVGRSPEQRHIDALNRSFDRSTNPLVVVAKVEAGGMAATVRITIRVSCTLPGKDQKSADAILLARLVYAEAGATPTDEEKAAIAWSVINRRNRVAGGDPEARRAFGDEGTLESVIAHKADGRVQYEAYWKKGAQWTAIDEPWKLSCDGCARLRKSLEIAEKALAGQIADPYAREGGAYYFHLSRTGVIAGDRQYSIRRLSKRGDFTHHFWTYDPP